ncbi:hypothetical protein JCM15908A_17100 [Prevotella dentasini JCM 15908]
MPSPEVANLGTFGSVPVGHYTGTPNISVPLYTMNVGKISIPLQAMYHVSNVKPHTPPSCLGIGWVLSAGGYIARNIKGAQDEKETSFTKAGFYFNHNKINQIERSPDKDLKLKELTHLFGNDWYELAADEFFFSFNGYSGSFFMDKDGQWRVISDDDIKVEFDDQNGFKTIEDMKRRFDLSGYPLNTNKRFFDRFTLITPDGTRYEFGGGNATEYSVPYYNQVNGDIVATCWRLSKITTIDKRVVNFEYAADSYMCDIHYAPQSVVVYKAGKDPLCQENYGRTGYSGFLMMPSRLIKISYNDVAINFSYKRDTAYGELFLANTGCLYWYKKEGVPYDKQARYMYGYWEQQFNANKFSLFMNIRPLPSEEETRKNIAKKITQDYLSNISIKLSNKKILDISFDFLSSIKKRRLLSRIAFYTTADCTTHTMEIEGVNHQGKTGSSGNSINPDTSSPNLDTKRTKNNGLNLNDGNIFLDNLIDDNFKTSKQIKEYEYNFEYYLDTNPKNLWPTRNPLTYTDSWGYFSKNSPNTFDYREWRMGESYGLDKFTIRPASLASTEIFALKDITYPTGGRTSFEYELNDFSAQFVLQEKSVKSATGNAGGLRVKSLKNYDSTGALLYSKDYIYKNRINGNSSGISKGKPCFYDRIYFNDKKSEFIDFYSFDDINPYPMNFNTPAVGYSTVFEELKDNNNKLLKRTKYQYTNYDRDANNNYHMDKAADYKAYVYGTYASAAFTSMAFERGKLISVEVTDADNKVLEKTTFDYWRSVGEPYSTISHECHLDYNQNFFGFSYLYKTYTNKYLISVNKREETTENGIFKTKTDYWYSNNGMLHSKNIISDNGNYERISYTYSFDNSSFSWLTQRNILVPVGIDRHSNEYLVQEKFFYSPSANGIPYISRKEITRGIKWGIGAFKKSTTTTEYVVEKADEYGNPIVVDDRGIKTIMIWSHQGQRMVAAIQNATYEDVKNALGCIPESISGLNKPSVSLEALRIHLGKALVSTYEYDNRLNLISRTEPNGLCFLFSYDLLGRLTAEYRKVNGKVELLKSYTYNYYTK